MSEYFTTVLLQAQKAIEQCLDGTGYNPFSVIAGEASNVVGDLTDEEIGMIIAERPGILTNQIPLQDPPQKSVVFGDMARDAVRMEIEKNIDMEPVKGALIEWIETVRIPAHLAMETERVLRSRSAARP